jgi:hypothetical protein
MFLQSVENSSLVPVATTDTF